MPQLSRWSSDEFVRRPGDARFEFPAMPQFGLNMNSRNVMSPDPYWIVEATFGEPGTASAGSASFGHCMSYTEAAEQLAQLLASDEESRYTDWVIVEHRPVIISKVVHREPRRVLR